MGGAEATGGVNDTAVVYTPAFHEYNDQGERRVYVWNVTLPLHFFSRAPVNPDEGEINHYLWLEAVEAIPGCAVSSSPLYIDVLVRFCLLLLSSLGS